MTIGDQQKKTLKISKINVPGPSQIKYKHFDYNRGPAVKHYKRLTFLSHREYIGNKIKVAKCWKYGNYSSRIIVTI